MASASPEAFLGLLKTLADAAELEKLALGLDRGRDHHLGFVHVADGVSPAHAHSNLKGPDEVLGAVGGSSSPRSRYFRAVVSSMPDFAAATVSDDSSLINVISNLT